MLPAMCPAFAAASTQPSGGEDNAFGAYGYHRDGKKGKKQIVHAGLHGSVPRQ
jgi:hypothetical protein